MCSETSDIGKDLNLLRSKERYIRYWCNREVTRGVPLVLLSRQKLIDLKHWSKDRKRNNLCNCEVQNYSSRTQNTLPEWTIDCRNVRRVLLGRAARACHAGVVAGRRSGALTRAPAALAGRGLDRFKFRIWNFRDPQMFRGSFSSVLKPINVMNILFCSIFVEIYKFAHLRTAQS